MTLRKWKELAKNKSELGHRINTVRNAIIQHDLGQKTSQASFTKVFQPVTTKLDDVIAINLKMSQTKRPPMKKGEVPNYGIDIEDEVPDMNLGDLLNQYYHSKKNNLFLSRQHMKNQYWKVKNRLMLILNTFLKNQIFLQNMKKMKLIVP